MTKQKIVIIGAGGHAKEAVAILEQLSNPPKLVGFAEQADRLPDNRTCMGYPCDTREALLKYNPTHYLLAVGNGVARRQLVPDLAQAGLQPFILTAPHVFIGKQVTLGQGCLIYPNSVLTADIIIGDHVHINTGCTISHDCSIGDYTTISPGVHIAGNVRVEEDVFIGIGANIINGTPGAPLVIGKGSVIAAGALVKEHVSAGSMVAGVPAMVKRK